MEATYDNGETRELSAEEAAQVASGLELMEGHAERVAAHMADRAKPSTKPHGVTVRRRDQRPTPTMAELTGAQRHTRLAAAANIELNQRIMDSGLWDDRPRSRRSWCALLRELELHPERLDAIKARMARQTGLRTLPALYDEVTA